MLPPPHPPPPPPPPGLFSHSPPLCVSVAHGHICLNCKHQPNVCKFLLVLEVQILDTAFSADVEKCRKKMFSILSISGFALRSTPLFHHHFIIHPVLFILCFITVKRVASLFHPSCIYNHSSIKSLTHYVWSMYSVSWVIYSSSSRCEWLCGPAVYFFLADGDLQQREWIFCSSVMGQKV